MADEADFQTDREEQKAWQKLREEGGTGLVVEQQNKAERCRETDGGTEQREAWGEDKGERDVERQERRSIEKIYLEREGEREF